MQYLDLEDLRVREFDKRLQQEVYRVKDHLELELSLLQPLFGEETGEFIDFTKWQTSNCARLKSLKIFDVKAPHLGKQHPASVKGHLTLSLSDLPNEKSRQEFLETLKPSSILYLVALDKSAENPFNVKLLRSVTLINDFEKVEENEYRAEVELDPVQYREDL